MAVAPFVDRQSGISEILQAAAVATGNGATCDLSGCNALTISVTIATTATVTFECSYDGGVTWQLLALTKLADGALASALTASGIVGLPSHAATVPLVRARISAWTAGAVTVTSRKAYR